MSCGRRVRARRRRRRAGRRCRPGRWSRWTRCSPGCGGRGRRRRRVSGRRWRRRRPRSGRSSRRRGCPAWIFAGLGDGVGECLLPLAVEGGVDLVAAEVELLVGQVRGLLGVLGGQFHQVVALLAGVVERVGLQRLGKRLVLGALGRRQLVDLDHAVEDPGPAFLGPLVVGLAQGGVVQARALEQSGEHGRLGRVELADVLAVVGLGGALDAVGAAAEPAGVEIALEDLVLAHLVVELERDHRLGELTADGLVLVQIDVLHVLLSNSGTALGVPLSHGAEQGAADALHGNSGVGVEGLVLRGEHRPADVRGMSFRGIAWRCTQPVRAIGVPSDQK